MAAYYIYLLSSLPLLSFGQKPPFTADEFIGRCRGLLPEGEIDLLGAVLKGARETRSESAVLREWYRFDNALRNELVKLRAARKKIEPAKYLRGESAYDVHIVSIATSAVRNPSILDAERALDSSRWQSIDEASAGHYFDLEALVAYALKLSILLRWERVSSSDKGAALAQAIAGN